MIAFIAWDVWATLSKAARRDIEHYFENPQRSESGLTFEIASYRIEQILKDYGRAIADAKGG